LLDTIYAAYPPNKGAAGCVLDDEEDAWLILFLADRPTREGRATSYICAGYGCQNPRPDLERLARQLGFS
jgi:uncharacterized protein